MTTTVLDIEELSNGRFNVYKGKELLLKSCRDPEFEAARALVDAGVTGWMKTRHKGSETIAFELEIEKAAKLSTLTPDKGTLAIRKWVPFNKTAFKQP